MRNIFIFFFCIQAAFVQAENIDIPRNSRIIHGQLENGLHYYVCPNVYPKEQACFRLIVKVGSIYEEDQERGIAHFVEHMVFRGSKHFRDGEIFKYLESIGAWPGADTNAHTGCETTVYKIDLPNTKSESIDKALFMLNDMAFHATLPDELVKKERTVILDELYQSFAHSGSKFNEVIFNFFAKGSAYEDRLPGGDVEIVKSCPPNVIRDFYHRWYRPDRMAVVAVGDFDAKAVEKTIVELFSKENREGQIFEEPSFEVDFPEENRAMIYYDPALTSSVITLLHPYSLGPDSSGEEMSVADCRKNACGVLFKQLFEKRLEALPDRYPDLFLYTWAQNSMATEFQGVFQIGAICFEERFEEALSVLNLELRRIEKWGFLEEEFQQLRREMIANLEIMRDDPEFKDHESLVETCSEHFLLSDPMLDETASMEMLESFLRQATLADINEQTEGEQEAMDGGFLIVLKTPSAQIAQGFSEEKLLSFFKKEETIFSPFEHSSVEDFDFSFPLHSGEIIKETIEEESGICFWKLSNGMTVAYKKTTLPMNEIVLYGFAVGGYDLIDPQDYPSACFAVPYYLDSGLGNFSCAKYRQFLTDRQIGLDLSVQRGRRAIALFSPIGSLESGCQLVHTIFVERKFDPTRWEILAKRYNERAQYRKNDPKTAFFDFVNWINFQNHYLFQPISPNGLNEAAAKRSYELFFGNPADFIFVLAGDLEKNEAQYLIETYLASIPKRSSMAEHQHDAAYEFPKTTIYESFCQGDHQGSETIITFPYDYNEALEQCGNGVSLIGSPLILERRLHASLRESKGDSYGVSVSSEYPYSPSRKQALIKIHFTSHNTAIQPMVEIIFEEIQKLKKIPPTEEEVNAVRKLLHSARSGEESNWGWVREIVASYDADISVSEIRNFENFLISMTPESIQLATQGLFTSPYYTVLSHLPEK